MQHWLKHTLIVSLIGNNILVAAVNFDFPQGTVSLSGWLLIFHPNLVFFSPSLQGFHPTTYSVGLNIDFLFYFFKCQFVGCQKQCICVVFFL